MAHDPETQAIYVKDTDDCLLVLPTLRRAFDFRGCTRKQTSPLAQRVK